MRHGGEGLSPGLRRIGSAPSMRSEKRMHELVVTREHEFPAMARRIFDEVKNKFPSVDPVCQPKGSQ
jgi:hypothetical protein